MSASLVPHRQSFSELVAVPRSLSALILAAALFFAAIPEVRLTSYLPLATPLFLLAFAAGIVERGLHREYVTRRPLRLALAGYLVAGTLLVISYTVNAVMGLFHPERIERLYAYAGELALPTATTDFLHGTLGNSYIPLRNLLIGVVVIPLAMLAIRIRSWQEFRFLILVWTAGGVYGACFAIAYCKGYITDHWEWTWVYLRRVQGLTVHPGALGLTSMLAFPGILMLLIECRNKLVIGIALVCACLAWMSIDYSGSRSAAGGVLILCAITYVVQMPTWAARRRAAIIVALLGVPTALLIGVAAPLLGIGPSSALLRLASGNYSSDSVRTLVNSSALDQALDSPVFGVGYQVLQVAHNNYLQIWHAGGVVGLLGFVLTLAVPMWLLYDLRPIQPEQKVCAVMFSCIMTIVLLYWVQSNPNYFAIMLLFGLATFAGLAARRRNGFDPLGREGMGSSR
ncbi:MAG: hypothetical protein M3O62_18370 [Pseudomonadota bacterium]|nr:hypothetical protein [Pseudomonadota bacterium]